MPKKPAYLSYKMKTLTSSNYHSVQYFLPKYFARLIFNNVYKKVLEFF